MNLTHLLTPQAQKMESSLVRELLQYSQQPDILSLAGGLPDETLMPPLPTLAPVASFAQYGPSEGEPALRKQISEIISERGLSVEFKQVLVTNGSQQGLDLISRLVLNPGDVILTEQPTYLAALQVFQLQGAVVKTVESDETGMNPDALKAAIEQYNPKAVYLIPNFQNPAGHCYSLSRRETIASIIDASNILLIEDDPYRDLYYDEVVITPIASMLNSAPWVYMGSFSKVLWPGLRVGYVSASPEVVPFLVKIKQASDLHTNRLGQSLVSTFIAEGKLPAHLEVIRSSYKGKRDVMAAALQRELGDCMTIHAPKGGMFFWMALPEGVSSKQILHDALEQKVLVLPGTPFFPTKEAYTDGFLRLSFARLSHADIEKSISVLAGVIRSHIAKR